MGYENSAGLGNFNHYGIRETNVEDIGIFKTEGVLNELSFDVTGSFISDVITNGTSKGLSTVVIPAGALIIEAIVNVTSVFTLGGTTPTIEVGTEGSEATNNFEISEAQAEAAGTVVITTFAGTWAARLAADTQIGFALGGSSPTIAAGGAARITIRFVNTQ